MLDDSFSKALASGQQALRDVVQTAVCGRHSGSGAELVAGVLRLRIAARGCRRTSRRAQRDFFGAHTYRRVDRDGVFHTEWTPA